MTSVDIVDFFESINNKRIAIFGCGLFGKEVKKILKDAYTEEKSGNKFVCFFDNDSLKYGSVLDGYEILKFNNEIVFSKNIDYIVIASMYFEDIYNQVLDMGVEEKKVIIAKELNHYDSRINGENDVIQHYIKNGNVVFDIGANIGQWSSNLLQIKKNINLHIFEPGNSVYNQNIKNLSKYINDNKIYFNNSALGLNEKISDFFYYEEAPTLSSFYERTLDTDSCEKVKKSMRKISVRETTFDSYCSQMGINRINFLKVDVEGNEFNVLKGAEKYIRNGDIDFIQFEYGGTYLDSGIKLKDVIMFLKKYRYEIFKIGSNELVHIDEFRDEYEDYTYSNFLAVNERFKLNILNKPIEMLNLKKICSDNKIIPKGVIHIGAHTGEELSKYKDMNFNKILFVEANPEVYKKLKKNVENEENVITKNCAISDVDGEMTFNIASDDQCSSILPLGKHLELYPDVKQQMSIKVNSRKLDSLIKELNINCSEFNILNIDIQGAELLALKGATETLKYIEGISLEVNYDEVYKGCALISDIDRYLESEGFIRVATITPYSPFWGDAFYVRKSVLSMHTFGKNGRFANQLFQYTFMKIYSNENGLRLELPEWDGDKLFDLEEHKVINSDLKSVKEYDFNVDDYDVAKSNLKLENVDLWGYFQYNTNAYFKYKEYIRKIFKPSMHIKDKLDTAMSFIRSKGRTIVALHIRRGDYGYSKFFITPTSWYKRFLDEVWDTLDNPVLYIASDEIDKVIDDFKEYNPISFNDLGVEINELNYYIDFYVLTKCNVLAISNSTFSFFASMLNEDCRIFVRPTLKYEKLIAYDPWNSRPLFQDITQELSDSEKYKANYDNLLLWYNKILKGKLSVGKHLKSINVQKVAIYGLGTMANIICDELEQSNIEVKYFIQTIADRDSYMGKIVLDSAGIKDNDSDIEAIIISISYDTEKIIKMLSNLGVNSRKIFVIKQLLLEL